MLPVSSDVRARMLGAPAAPSLAAVAVEFPPHCHSQEEIATALTGLGGREFQRFIASSGVKSRHHALPLESYADLGGFT
ncbi:MAG: hypothetical protein ACRDTV_12090, partial [Mycobacterium sp.]